ncbi:MAG: hypothetical protein IPN09_03785 [Bacteroidetes bacterium]|nr:hypothetical protein [Bacteroidota bacterium]
MDWLKNIKETLNLDKIVAPVNNARRYYQMLENLMDLVNDSKVSNSVKDMVSGLGTILKSQPNIMSINHFLNHWLLRIDPENQPIVIKELLEVFHERWKNVDRKTAHTAYTNFDFHEKTIIFHGADKSIESFVELMAVNQKKMDIIQTMAKPAINSRHQATEFATHTFGLQIINAEAAGNFLAKADALVIPASIIMRDEFVAPIGTYLLAAACKGLNKPLFIFGDTRKILSKKYFPESVFDSLIGESAKPPGEVWKGAPKNAVVFNQYIEIVPNEFVTHFMLENNAFTPEQITEQVDKVLITKLF